MKRSRLVLVVILVAMGVLCVSLWLNEGPLWRMVMLRTVECDNSTGRMRYTVRRFTAPVSIRIPDEYSLSPPHSWVVSARSHPSPGTAQGEFNWWWPSGSLRQRGNYDEGEPNGTWTEWYESGEVKVQHRYRKGELVTRQASPPWWNGVKDQTP